MDKTSYQRLKRAGLKLLKMAYDFQALAEEFDSIIGDEYRQNQKNITQPRRKMQRVRAAKL